MNKLVPVVFWMAMSVYSNGEAGGVELIGGKPIKIVFPSNCESLDWKSSDFSSSVTIFCNGKSGIVSGIWVKADKGEAWTDSPEISKILPAWQLGFLTEMSKAVYQWKFQETKAVTGQKTDEKIGYPLRFRFVRSWDGKCKTQVIDGDSIVADDAPRVTPSLKSTSSK